MIDQQALSAPMSDGQDHCAKAEVGKNFCLSRKEGKMAGEGEMSPDGLVGVSWVGCIQVWCLLLRKGI